jgi:DNA-binding NarL/FixJ family response regulator
MQLPDGTGFDVREHLKNTETAIIYLTIVDDEGNIVRALEGGAVGIPLAYFAISSSVGSIVVVRTERLMPIGSIAAAVGIIAAVVACTTLYSVRLSRNVNLIDAIRGE